MFRVIEHTVSRVSNKCTIGYAFNYHNEAIKTETKDFPHEETAIHWLNKAKKDWLSIAVEKYVRHKKVLMETGDPGYYKTQPKLEALSRCEALCKFLVETQTYPLEKGCEHILKQEDKLKQLLPSPNNSSFTSSAEAILDIITFCKHHVQQQQ